MFRKWLQLATGLLVVAACGQANSASLVASQKLPWATAERRRRFAFVKSAVIRSRLRSWILRDSSKW
jgi:hypothetical protein